MTSGIEVREARPTEWEVWRDLRLRALADSPDAFGTTLADVEHRDDAVWRDRVAPDPTRTVVFAWRGTAPVGTIVVRRTAGDEAHVYAMWVAPEARRTGAGRALVGEAKRWARFRGARRLVLEVTGSEAEAFYATVGFVPTGATSPLRPGSAIWSRTMRLELGPLVMGVVNVTPDSFSDGGRFFDFETAVAHARSLWEAGADLIDVGGEATNPRATPVDAAEEARRVEPLIRALVAANMTVSIDTTKAEVATRAVAAGAAIVNDVSGGLFDPGMSSILADFEGIYIAGHLRGTNLAEVFANEARVDWRDVASELGQRLDALPAKVRARAWVDPGVGFGKGRDVEGNLALLRHAGDLGRSLGCPVVVGPSRKRFVRRMLAALGREPSELELDVASVEASLVAVRAGAHVVRVHNVALLQATLAVYTRG